MLLFIIMFLGIVVSINIPVDFLPNIEYPIITVNAEYSGAGPEEVEISVTRPLESALAAVENITEISSVSREGSSSVRLEFTWGQDLDKATFDVREKLDLVRGYLPDDIRTLKILKYSSDDNPVIGFLLVGIDDPATAFDIAENQIKRSIEQVSGVGEVSISGGIETEVHIELTKNRLQAYNISAEEIAQIVRNNDISSSGGYIYQGAKKIGIRADAELKNLEDFRNIVVSYREGIPVFLKDIADIYYGAKEDNPRMFVTRPDLTDESPTKAGRGGVLLEIIPSSGANNVLMERAIQKHLDELRSQLPPRVEIKEVYNTANDIRAAINGVTQATLQGAFFALLIMFFYLWDWRSLVVLGLSIPTSIITTFIAMFLTDTTFNIMSISGLTLAVGMMVDSSIVVLENIFNHRSRGEGKYAASINGTKEVWLAITASTFTTIAVFFPILFVEGQTAQLFKDLITSVVVGLLAALLISITLVPMLCSLIIKEIPIGDAFDNKNNTKTRFNDKILQSLDSQYKKALEWSIRHKKRVVLGGNALVLVFIALLLYIMPKEYMPPNEESNMGVYLTYPLGTKYEYNETISRKILKDIRTTIGDDLKHITLQVKTRWGGSTSDHRSRMNIELLSKSERISSLENITEKVRRVVAKYPVKTYISTGGRRGRSGGESLALQLQGNDLKEMYSVADQIISVLSNMDGLSNPRKTSDDATPEVKAIPDRVALARAGLTIRDLFSNISTSFGGRTVATIIGESGHDIDVRVRIKEEDRLSIDSLKNLNIPTTTNTFVSLGSLVDLNQGYGPTWIKRTEAIRSLDLRAGVKPDFAKDILDIVAKVRVEISEKVYIPPSVILVFKGDYEDARESMLLLTLAFIGAVFIVYALMVALFESYLAPFVIMISVPFGALGAMLLLYLSGHSLNIYSMIGIVIQVGIVINNGIVLIDYMNQLIQKQVPVDEAALQAGVRRIRPVCMTTFTTILGMIPMSLGMGEGSEDYAPLATSVIGGLSFALVFTLIIVPVAYAAIRKRFPMKIKDMSL